MLYITPTLSIDDSELEEKFVRASGPGGQNVNKVATAVQLRFNAGQSAAIDAEVRERLKAIAGSRLTAEGVLVIDSREFDAYPSRSGVSQATVRPKRRRKTRPSGAAKAKRLDSKRRRSGTKHGRRRVGGEE